MKKILLGTVALVSLASLSFSTAALAENDPSSGVFGVKATEQTADGQGYSSVRGIFSNPDREPGNPDPGGNGGENGGENPGDTEAPTATVTLSDMGSNSAMGIVTFSEEVTGFSSSALRLVLMGNTNATIVAVNPIGPNQYMVSIQGNGAELSKSVRLVVLMDAVEDLAGNRGVGEVSSELAQ